MNNPQTFTATDIERYHRGGMTAAEMHNLEKAALDDPLLADALEGYGYTKTAAADLQLLRSVLQQRLQKEDRKVVPLWSRQWLRIAALFVVLAGAGWLVFQTFSAKDRNLAATEATSSDLAVATDSAASAQPLPPGLATDSIATLQDVAKAERPGQQRESEKAMPLTVLNENTATTKKAREDNTVVATEPVAAAPTAGKLGPAAAPAVDGRQINDSANLADAQAKQNSAADTKEKEVRLQSRSKMAAAEPVGGWKAFTDYVKKNRRTYTELNIASAVRGQVELRFDIDENGRPVNVTVSKLLCPPCDAEAVRLLKQGPSWTPRNGSGLVSISFP